MKPAAATPFTGLSFLESFKMERKKPASLEFSTRSLLVHTRKLSCLEDLPRNIQGLGAGLQGVPSCLQSEASELAWARKETSEVGREEVTHWLKEQAGQFPTGSRTK